MKTNKTKPMMLINISSPVNQIYNKTHITKRHNIPIFYNNQVKDLKDKKIFIFWKIKSIREGKFNKTKISRTKKNNLKMMKTISKIIFRMKNSSKVKISFKVEMIILTKDKKINFKTTKIWTNNNNKPHTSTKANNSNPTTTTKSKKPSLY